MTFDSNGGSAIAPVLDIAEGAVVTEPSAPKPGAYFWWLVRAVRFSETAWDFATDKMPAKDVTLYAKWTPTTYAISYELNGGTNYLSAITNYTIASWSDYSRYTKVNLVLSLMAGMILQILTMQQWLTLRQGQLATRNSMRNGQVDPAALVRWHRNRWNSYLCRYRLAYP